MRDIYKFKGDANQPEMKKVSPQQLAAQEQKVEVKLSFRQMQKIRSKFGLRQGQIWSDQIQLVLNKISQ